MGTIVFKVNELKKDKFFKQKIMRNKKEKK